MKNDQFSRLAPPVPPVRVLRTLPSGPSDASTPVDHCVEVATFTLKPGVTDAQLLALEERIRAGAIASQAGFMSRELCKDDASGEWLIVMRFESRAQMDAWLAIVRTVPEMREMGALIASFGTNRFFAHRA